MDCFPDFCLACDNQTVEGLYCSEACRLADIEKGSAPQSPLTTSPFSWSNVSYGVSSHGVTQALNEQTSTTRRPATATHTSPSSTTSYRSPSHAVYRSASYPSTPTRVLSPSSSRSSLASTISGVNGQTSDGLSEQAKKELRAYFDCFEHTKENRRRSQPALRKDDHHEYYPQLDLAGSFAND